MWKSLRFKMTLCMVSLVIVIMLVSILVSKFFLGDFYLLDKQKSLVETYTEINAIYQQTLMRIESMDDQQYILGVQPEAQMQDAFEQIAENTGMSILIFRDSEEIGYDYQSNQHYTYKYIMYSSIGMDRKDNIENSNLYNDFYNAKTEPNVLQEEQNYSISQVYVSRLSSNYLYLQGMMTNGDVLLLRASYQSVDESANLAISFISYVSVTLLIIGAVVLIFVTHRITKPITDLSAQAKKIAELKFDTHYEGKSKDELGELGRSINYLSDSLEEALGELKTANSQLQRDLEIMNRNDEMRKEFLSNVSHELKTPIALIQGYAEGLLENVNDDPESQQFYCEVIADEAAKMNGIVKKLLDLNHLEFGRAEVDMQHFDIVEVIRNYLDNSEILLRQKGIQLKLDLPESAYVWADAFMVEEIFNNYFSNALNHVAGENVICITVEPREEVTRVIVFNTGEQIPEADLDRIWDKFYKVDKARTREYGGSGVGLSIVKASMDILGQAYGVENQEDGVAFYFELDSKN